MPRIVLSQLRNPYWNLAIETVLFRQLRPGEHTLFLYVNDPCVVIGRNQNPWAECNLTTFLPILRRRSGGGAVVHDRGNINFGVQFPRSEFSHTRHLEMILRALPDAGLAINDRHDIVLGDRKVSGSSYRIEKERAYHHATMLLSSDLHRLSAALKPDPAVQGSIVSRRGTDSVRSPVVNTMVSPDMFVAACVAEFTRMYPPAVIPEVASPAWLTDEVKEEIATLESWEWTFGKTPRFTIEWNGALLDVDKGIVTEVLRGESDLLGKRLPRTIYGL